MIILLLKLLVIDAKRDDVQYRLPRQYGMDQWLYELKENVEKDSKYLYEAAYNRSLSCVAEYGTRKVDNDTSHHAKQVIFGVALNLKNMVICEFYLLALIIISKLMNFFINDWLGKL